MTTIPEDVKEAVRTVEEFRATAAPQEQTELERARAEINSEVQQNAQQIRQAKMAEGVQDRYPFLADALRNRDSVNTDFPAVNEALTTMQNVEQLEQQKRDLEQRIKIMRANSEAALAAANAALEVRQRQNNDELELRTDDRTTNVRRDEAPE